jgi:hypothetical protein
MTLHIGRRLLIIPAEKTVTCICGAELPFDTPEQIEQAQAHQLECIAEDERGPDRVGELAHARETEQLTKARDQEVHDAIRKHGRPYVTGGKD